MITTNVLNKFHLSVPYIVSHDSKPTRKSKLRWDARLRWIFKRNCEFFDRSIEFKIFDPTMDFIRCVSYSIISHCHVTRLLWSAKKKVRWLKGDHAERCYTTTATAFATANCQYFLIKCIIGSGAHGLLKRFFFLKFHFDELNAMLELKYLARYICLRHILNKIHNNLCNVLNTKC